MKELDELPNGLNKMPSIVRVKDWYAQSFEVSLARVRQPLSIASLKRTLPLSSRPAGARCFSQATATEVHCLKIPFYTFRLAFSSTTRGAGQDNTNAIGLCRCSWTGSRDD